MMKIGSNTFGICGGISEERIVIRAVVEVGIDVEADVQPNTDTSTIKY
jgi:hypothetical protein